ncbi:hypothetical protein CPB86DRAFT_351251 [Serendipita vermifera]|nr:hypothetical protein CPB86DRAFT_351251 [Serendipita vermifera]
MAKRRSLKAALKSHLHNNASREKKLAAVRESMKVKAPKDKGQKAQQSKPRPIIPYSQFDSILLIGEGDFSFAQSLINSHNISPEKVTATAFDSEAVCYDKYPWARDTVLDLRNRGMKVSFKIDATKLDRSKELKGKRYSKVVFNFPHTGKGIKDQDRNILSNQELVKEFLKTVPSVLVLGSSNESRTKQRRPQLSDDSGLEDNDLIEEESPSLNTGTRGTVLVTLRDTPPYTLWNVPELAKKPSEGEPRYKQLRSFAFNPDHYPGYAHRRTAGHKGDREVPVLKEREGVADARTWEFELVVSATLT